MTNRLQCRRCLMTFELWNHRPPGARKFTVPFKCTTRACGQPFSCRYKIVQGKNFLVPCIVGEPCPKFLAISLRGQGSSSSEKRPER